eukprot:3315427-Pyramimonas_sp.AAC.1
MTVRDAGSIPNLWNVSQGCRIGKHNGKIKCKGERLIHLLDPVGKSFIGSVWRRRVGYSTHHSVGFREGRRREQLILQHKLVRWQLSEQCLGWFTAFYDQANAFASVSRAALDSTIYRMLTAADAALVVGRHRHAMTLVQTDSGEWSLYALGCGDLQGDQSAPDRFLQVFDPAVDEWVDQTRTASERDFFTVTDPVSRIAVDVSYGAYADDLERSGLANGALEAVRKIESWDEALEKFVADPINLRQNSDKKELMFRQYGKGAPTEMKAFYQQLKVPGEAKLVVRHLGAYHQTDGWEYHEYGQRQQVARSGWAAMGHFWGQRGGEAWLPTQQLHDQIDRFVQTHGRVLLLGGASPRSTTTRGLSHVAALCQTS